jgi:hypothetical protein
MRALLITIAATAALVVGCGGTDPALFQTPPDPPSTPDDAGPPGNFVGGDDASDAKPTPTACTPADMTGFQPAWTPPQAWKQGVCTTKQVTDFYTSCLASPIAPSTCDAYAQANATCVACLQSKDTDATWGAVVWHDEMRFWTVNVAGCLSYVLGDGAGTGCAGAYEGAVQCRQKACDACWANTANTFQQFAACEGQAGQTQCTAMDQMLGTKCGDLSMPPANTCVPPTGSTTKDAYLLVAPAFCGPKG